MRIVPVKIPNYKASRPMFVSDRDFKLCSAHSWSMNSSGYPQTWFKNKVILAHRFILNAKKGQIIDHKNSNKLDNRRSNLRFCSQSENIANQQKPKTNKSGFKGVSYKTDKTWKSLKNRWRAQIKKDKKVFHLGLYSTPEQAHEAYKKAAKKLYGRFAKW